MRPRAAVKSAENVRPVRHSAALLTLRSRPPACFAGSRKQKEAESRYAIAGSAISTAFIALAVGAGAAGAQPQVSDYARITGSVTPPTESQCESVGRRCFTPQAVQSAYNVSPLYAAGFDGRGKTIAVVDSYGSDTMVHDLHVYDQAFGLQPMCGDEGVPQVQQRLCAAERGFGGAEALRDDSARWWSTTYCSAFIMCGKPCTPSVSAVGVVTRRMFAPGAIAWAVSTSSATSSAQADLSSWPGPCFCDGGALVAGDP